MANKQIIKERRLQDDAWKVVNLVDGEAPFDVCLPVGPLLVPVSARASSANWRIVSNIS